MKVAKRAVASLAVALQCTIARSQSLEIEKAPPALDELKQMDVDPDDFDEAAKILGIEPVLTNPYLATTLDLSGAEGELAQLGEVLYLASHISPNRGRMSIHFAPKDYKQAIGGIGYRTI